MARQIIQVADKPTLDEIKEALESSQYGLQKLAELISAGSSDTGVDEVLTLLRDATNGLTAIKNAINTTNSTLGNTTYGANALKTAINAISTSLANTTYGLSAIRTALSTVGGEISNNSHGLTALMTGINNIGGYINNSTYGLNALKTDLGTLKNSVSNGKASVANAITAKGVTTATNADFSVLAANIAKIQTGAVKEDKYQMFDKGDGVNLFGFLSTDNNSNFIMPAFYADSWVFHSKDANAQASWGEYLYFNGTKYSGQQTAVHFAGSKITSSSYLNQCLFETNDDSTAHLYRTADNLYPPRIMVLLEKLAEGSFTMTYLAVTRTTLQNGIVYESRKGNGMQFKIYVTATSGYASQISKIRVYANKLGSNPSSDHINLGIIIFY